VAKRAVAEGITIREAALAEGVLDGATLDRLLDPLPLTEPGLPGE
jgi:fumarate hydratase class II